MGTDVRRMKIPEHLQPPTMRRRVSAPQTLAVLVGLCLVPVLAALVDWSGQAGQTACHVALAFVALLVLFRVIGKRELSRLSPFEFVTLMLVPEIVSQVVQGEGNLSASFVGLCTLFALVLITSLLSHRFTSVQQLMESAPTLLVAGGRLLEANMNRERIAPAELIAEMHKHGIANLEDVSWAILEGSGDITFVRRETSPQPTILPARTNP